MIRFFNIVYYNLFRFEKKVQKLFTYPTLLFIRNKRVRKNYRSRGVKDPERKIIAAIENPEVGISSIFSGGHVILLFILLIFGFTNLFLGIIRLNPNYSLWHFAVIGGLGYLLGHFLVFHKNKYLQYFKEFETMADAKKRALGWITCFVVLGIWLFGIGSFIFLNYRLS